MKELLLDSRTIIEDPRILGLDKSKFKLLTIPFVIEEIRTSGNDSNISYANRLKLIEKAVYSENINIVPSNIEEIQAVEFIQYSITSPRLNNTEKNILAYILFRKQKGENIYLVTDNKLLKKIAASYKIELFDNSELDKLLNEVESKSDGVDDIYSQIENYERKEKNKIFSGILLGIFLSFIAFNIYTNIDLIIASTNVWGAISLIILLSFILYIIREKWRLPYGFLEFSVGVFSIIVIFYPSRFNFDEIPFDSNLFIKIIGGLYIMVRGIDNVMIALKDTRFGIFFRRTLSLSK